MKNKKVKEINAGDIVKAKEGLIRMEDYGGMELLSSMRTFLASKTHHVVTFSEKRDQTLLLDGTNYWFTWAMVEVVERSNRYWDC